MNIDVILEDVHSTPVTNWADTKGLLAEILESYRQEFVLLKFIDPYGDTVFNKLQAETVLGDLELLRIKHYDKEYLAVIDEIYALATALLKGDSLYLRFVGD